MKKIVSLLLAVMLALSAFSFTACDKDKNETAEDTTAPAVEETVKGGKELQIKSFEKDKDPTGATGTVTVKYKESDTTLYVHAEIQDSTPSEAVDSSLPGPSGDFFLMEMYFRNVKVWDYNAVDACAVSVNPNTGKAKVYGKCFDTENNPVASTVTKTDGGYTVDLSVKLGFDAPAAAKGLEEDQYAPLPKEGSEIYLVFGVTDDLDENPGRDVTNWTIDYIADKGDLWEMFINNGQYMGSLLNPMTFGNEIAWVK